MISIKGNYIDKYFKNSEITKIFTVDMLHTVYANRARTSSNLGNIYVLAFILKLFIKNLPWLALRTSKRCPQSDYRELAKKYIC